MCPAIPNQKSIQTIAKLTSFDFHLSGTTDLGYLFFCVVVIFQAVFQNETRNLKINFFPIPWVLRNFTANVTL